MQIYHLPNHDGLDYQVHASLLGTAEKNSNFLVTNFALFQLEGGAMVCYECLEDMNEGPYSTRIDRANSMQEVISFFGQGNLAKELYDKAGLDLYIKIT